MKEISESLEDVGSRSSGVGASSRRRLFQGGPATGTVETRLSAGVTRAATFSERLDGYLEEFETVIDMVEAGADNSGNESVVDLIRKYRDDDTLLLFPPGEYYMDEQVRFTGFETFGLVGNGATLVPAVADRFRGPRRLFELGTKADPGTRLLVEGFAVDQTVRGTGVRAVDAVVDDGLEVRDVTIGGLHDGASAGPGRFVVSDPDGSGLVERFQAPRGGEWPSETPATDTYRRGPTGIVAAGNVGTLRFHDCVLGGFPDHGLYASDGTGTVIVQGGLYENSNAANVRIGGTDSVVADATIRVDSTGLRLERSRGLVLDAGTNLTVRGVTVDISQPGPASTGIEVMDPVSSAVIEDVHVSIESLSVDDGIVVHREAGDVTVRSSQIDLDTAGGYALQIQGDDDPGDVRCSALTILDDAGEESHQAAIRCDRAGTHFEDVTVEQPYGRARRALVNTATGVRIEDGEYCASEYPVVDLGRGTLVEDAVLTSRADYEAICLYEQSQDVSLRNNTLRNGIRDHGSTGLTAVDNGR